MSDNERDDDHDDEGDFDEDSQDDVEVLSENENQDEDGVGVGGFKNKRGYKKNTERITAKFLTKYELFKQILNVNGSIVEAGVLHGGGTLAWAKLSSILEPTNHTRKIIGFDTFEGFPSV